MSEKAREESKSTILVPFENDQIRLSYKMYGGLTFMFGMAFILAIDMICGYRSLNDNIIIGMLVVLLMVMMFSGTKTVCKTVKSMCNETVVDEYEVEQ